MADEQSAGNVISPGKREVSVQMEIQPSDELLKWLAAQSFKEMFDDD